MIAEQLRAETRIIHAKTEKLLVGRIKAARTLADYAAVLQAFYGFLAPLEQKLGACIDRARLPDHDDRRKASALARDLQALHHTTDDIPVATDAELPPIRDHAAAMGALYVFEGSTLGGSAIIGLLKARMDLPEDGHSFFTGYGPETVPMWKAFTSILNEERGAAAVVESAVYTFSQFHSWLQKTLVHAETVED